LEEEDLEAKTKTKSAPSAGLAFELVTGTTPNAAGLKEHDALADVLIECRVGFDEELDGPGKGLGHFKAHKDGIRPWSELHAAKKAKQDKVREELRRPVPGAAAEGGWKGWKGDGAAATEDPYYKDKVYNGPPTGPRVSGPAHKAISLVALVLLFFPVRLLKEWASHSNKYMGQMVHKVQVTYGSKTTRRTVPCGELISESFEFAPHLPCLLNFEPLFGQIHVELADFSTVHTWRLRLVALDWVAGHSLDRDCKWCDDEGEPAAEPRFKSKLFGGSRNPTEFTWQSILCFLGIVIAAGGTRTRNWKHMWETKHFYGATTNPWVVAGMTSTAFEHHLQFVITSHDFPDKCDFNFVFSG
jgi:hypothetical protein